jgi:hypothetical protein
MDSTSAALHFNKAYDSIRMEALHDALIEFDTPKMKVSQLKALKCYL